MRASLVSLALRYVALASAVTQVPPTGKLVVEGKQEIRVNFEIRELIVAGIVLP
jgi:flagellar basal body L-ring protein FlgH